ncbi:MAG: hypothetical protein V2A77_05095 [Pseudomonadota bacterium]
MVSGGDLYLGRLIPAGTKGVIVGYGRGIGPQRLYQVRLEDDGQLYDMAPAEVQEVTPK